MKSTRRILYLAGIVAAAVVVVGVFLPARGQVSREALIDAPSATVFVLLTDPGRARDWLPWIDRDATITTSGDSQQAGATMQWDGARSGSGSRRILERIPYERVEAALTLGDGRDARSTFELDHGGQGTRLRWTWSVDFGIDLLARYRGLFLDSSAGAALDRGLGDLETLAESLPRADWSDIPIERLVVQPIDIAYQTATSLPNATAISEAMGAAYFNILAFMDRHGLEEAGPPLSISRRFSGSQFVFDAAIPVKGVTPETPRTDNGIRLGATRGGPVVRGRHVGSYGALRDTHEKIAAYLAVHGIARAGDAWEVYVSDPARTPEEDLVTEVYYPVADRAP